MLIETSSSPMWRPVIPDPPPGTGTGGGGGGSGASNWGEINGDIAEQNDLQSALDEKLDADAVSIFQGVLDPDETDGLEVTRAAVITNYKVNLQAGAGAYTFTMRLMADQAQSGDTMRIHATWPESVNPTLAIVNDASDETIFSYTGIAESDSDALLEFVFDGTNWSALSPNLVSTDNIEGYTEPEDPTPAPPSTDLILHLSAGDLTATLANEDAVPTWEDRSAAENDASQVSEPAQPVYKQNQVNGRSALEFDSDSDQFLELPGFLWEMANPRTVFVVYKPTASGVNSVVTQVGDPDASTWFAIQARDFAVEGDPYFAGYSDDLAGPALALGEWKLATVVYDGTDLSMWKNDTLIDTVAKALDTVANAFKIGAGDAGEFMHGQIAEVIAYSAALDNTNREAVWTYLNAKYALWTP